MSKVENTAKDIGEGWLCRSRLRANNTESLNKNFELDSKAITKMWTLCLSAISSSTQVHAPQHTAPNHAMKQTEKIASFLAFYIGSDDDDERGRGCRRNRGLSAAHLRTPTSSDDVPECMYQSFSNTDAISCIACHLPAPSHHGCSSSHKCVIKVNFIAAMLFKYTTCWIALGICFLTLWLVGSRDKSFIFMLKFYVIRRASVI